MLRTILGSVMILAAAATTQLTNETYTQLRDQIRPTPQELSWQTIPWQSTFWSAVIEAQQKEKPILAWMMNGHPLACT